MMEIIKIHGCVVRPARVNGPPDVFTSPHFSLIKAEWEPDEHKSHCDLCSIKFTQLKRKHHCRVCGLIRCAKCCSHKMPLPHLDLEEPERVCDSCTSVVELILKSRSHSTTKLIEAANGLALFANHQDHIKKLLEMGGVQTLVALSLTEDPKVLRHVVSGLHSLATHPSIHNLLADTGGIKALCKILSTTSGKDTQISADGIGALMIFCKSTSFKAKVINDGGLSPVLNLCHSSDDALSLLAISTLGLIAENHVTHAAILDDKQGSVAILLKLCKSEDEQIQEVALKTLAFLSTGSREHRHRILQEDFSNGSPVLSVLSSSPNNPQILSNATCLVANLAAVEENQPSLHGYLDCIRTRITKSDSTEITCNLTRSVANIAKYKHNSSHLLDVIPAVIENSLKSSNVNVRGQSMRFLVSMLAFDPARVSSLIIQQNGCKEFLASLGRTNLLLEAVQATMSNDCPEIAKPQ